MTISELLKKADALRLSGKKACTLLGVGPMSMPVLRAAFEVGRDKDFPVMLIASRNQVDSLEFGGGYVRGWDQRQFAAAVDATAEQAGFGGLRYICRDHGGPWQRDGERAAKLPEKEAMEIAKRSYLADLLAGFDLLHIDPTKDPHSSGVMQMETVLRRTVELIEFVESERIKRNLPPIDYEVGTEETNGGLTSPDSYKDFITRLKAMLAEKGLPPPAFIVGQTGTLVRLTENVGSFNADNASILAESARSLGFGLKEHNADYLDDKTLLLHPVIGVTAANVAPEFGVDETRAYLLLAETEKAACERGLIGKVSDFTRTIRNAAVDCGRWRKWMLGDVPNMASEDVKRDEAIMDIITRSSGHYTFDDDAVARELALLKENLVSIGMDPDRFVINRIKASIGRYAECFGLTGLTSIMCLLKLYK